MSNWFKSKSSGTKFSEIELKKSKSKNGFQDEAKNGSDEELKQILNVGAELRNDETTNQNTRVALTLTSALSQNKRTEFPRTVRKDGSFNWSAKTVGRHRFLLEDIFTTLVELRWRLLLFVFCVVYFGSWLAFSVIWYGLLYFHGDFEDENYGNSTWTPCITEFKDFTAAFLFSVETQHTTGYGYYHLTEECAGAIITFCLQSIVGCILEGVMVGILFVKIARGKKRTATLLFSKTAVILQHKGKLNFMFRVADLRNKSNLLEARIRAQLITRQKVGRGDGSCCDLRIGEFFLKKEELKVSANGEEGTDFFLFWPTTIVHEITSSSPLCRLLNQLERKNEDDDDEHYEIIVILEGIVEATGQMTQARSSYIPSEVIWGHSFTPMTMTPKKSSACEFEIDYSNFHETFPISVTHDVNFIDEDSDS